MMGYPVSRSQVSPWAETSFSNLLANGEPTAPQFRAVAVCCPAIDLATSADALHEPSNRIYETYFLWALRRRMVHKARLFPGYFDLGRLRGVRSLREFDDKITAFYCGFTGVNDYYDRASASHVVERIAVPTLVLYAANDPFVKITTETRRKIASNPNITFVEAADGGHCAFVGVRTLNGSERGDGYWAEQEIVNSCADSDCPSEFTVTAIHCHPERKRRT